MADSLAALRAVCDEFVRYGDSVGAYTVCVGPWGPEDLKTAAVGWVYCTAVATT